MESSSSSSSKYMDAMELEDEQKLQVRALVCVCVRVCARMRLCTYREPAWQTGREHVYDCACIWSNVCLVRGCVGWCVCGWVGAWVGACVRARAGCDFILPSNVQTVLCLSLRVCLFLQIKVSSTYSCVFTYRCAGTFLYLYLYDPQEHKYSHRFTMDLLSLFPPSSILSSIIRGSHASALANLQQYVFLYMYTCVCVCIRVHVHVCVYMCVHVCVCACVCAAVSLPLVRSLARARVLSCLRADTPLHPSCCQLPLPCVPCPSTLTSTPTCQYSSLTSFPKNLRFTWMYNDW